MLLFDDYNEMTRLQGHLMKVGFDVVPLMSDLRLSDKILENNPDLIFVKGATAKVSVVQVGRRLKELPRLQAKVVIALSPQVRLAIDDLRAIKMDLLVEFPQSSRILIEKLGQLLGMDTGKLIEKFDRAGIRDDFEAPEVKKPSRADRYRTMSLDNKAANETSFTKAAIDQKKAEMRDEINPAATEELVKSKQDFVRALFRGSDSSDQE